jgi:hypothetical protein
VLQILLANPADELSGTVVSENDPVGRIGGEQIIGAGTQTGEPGFPRGRLPGGQGLAFGIEHLDVGSQPYINRSILGNRNATGRRAQSDLCQRIALSIHRGHSVTGGDEEFLFGAESDPTGLGFWGGTKLCLTIFNEFGINAGQSVNIVGEWIAIGFGSGRLVERTGTGQNSRASGTNAGAPDAPP